MDESAVGDGCLAHGPVATASGGWLNCPFGSRFPVRQQSVSAFVEGQRLCRQHESQGGLLGQCGGGELLCQPEKRAGAMETLPDAR